MPSEREAMAEGRLPGEGLSAPVSFLTWSGPGVSSTDGMEEDWSQGESNP